MGQGELPDPYLATGQAVPEQVFRASVSLASDVVSMPGSWLVHSRCLGADPKWTSSRLTTHP